MGAGDEKEATILYLCKTLLRHFRSDYVVVAARFHPKPFSNAHEFSYADDESAVVRHHAYSEYSSLMLAVRRSWVTVVGNRKSVLGPLPDLYMFASRPEMGDFCRRGAGSYLDSECLPP